MRGRFVAFEGIDGSGKSTAIRRVAESLRERGIDIAVTREETDTWLGDAVRRSIKEHLDPLATLHLFVADRAQHVPQIRTELDAGRHVLTDRFHHSTYAYQSVTLADHLDAPLSYLQSLHAPFGLEPDHVLLFDVDAEMAVARADGRGETTSYEKVTFLERVAEAYRGLAKEEPDRFHLLDAGRSIDAVVAEATDVVAGWLKVSA